MKLNRSLIPLAMVSACLLSLSCSKDAEELQGDLVNAPHPNTVVAMSMAFSRTGLPFDKSVPFMDAAGTPVQIDRLLFYMSQVEFTDDAGDSVAAFPQKYLLVDLDEGGLVRTIGQLDGHLHEMHFGLGVDSAMNHADPITLAAPLNTSGMWWTWAAGHKFLALEGRYDSDNDGVVETTDNEFLFHCGMDTLYTPVTLQVHTDADMGGNVVLPLELSIDTLLAGMDIAAQPVLQNVTPVTQGLMQRLARSITHIE